MNGYAFFHDFYAGHTLVEADKLVSNEIQFFKTSETQFELTFSAEFASNHVVASVFVGSRGGVGARHA